MNDRIHSSPVYRRVEQFYASLYRPGERFVSDAADPCVSGDGHLVAFTGSVYDSFSGPARKCVYVAELGSGALTPVANDAGADHLLPKWSPDDRFLAYVSDREQKGSFQLILAERGANGDYIERAVPAVEGTIEYLFWSPDGKHIVAGVAGLGADLAGCQGGATIGQAESGLPDWHPELDTGDARNLWRRAWVYSIGSDSWIDASKPGLNYWEVTWCGADSLLAVVSDSHSEGSWYDSRLITQGMDGADITVLYRPTDQIGVPVATPLGNKLAFVEAVCSDRLVVCGTLKILDRASGDVHTLETGGVEVTSMHWRDEHSLVFAGHRYDETVVAELRTSDGTRTQHWCGQDRTFGGWYPSVCPDANGGALAFGESFQTAPELVRLHNGRYDAIRSFSSDQPPYPDEQPADVRSISWGGRDGLRIQGWLITPPGDGPFPLVMDIHGGPVWSCRNRWRGRLRGAQVLLDYGIALFYPNPRGSSGRGQDFARLVKGDMGGEDTHDYLTGCDFLVEQGIAKPDALGVTGISYGGFASAWLITQDNRFAAAVPISPVTNFYSQHHTSQIPRFDRLFLDSSPYEPDGKHYWRSPVMFAHKVTTPTLQLTGAKDKNTPPTQALEFHRALLEAGKVSVLATYPLAGHGVREFPEVIDATSRYVAWFLQHFGIEA